MRLFLSNMLILLAALPGLSVSTQTLCRLATTLSEGCPKFNNLLSILLHRLLPGLRLRQTA